MNYKQLIELESTTVNNKAQLIENIGNALEMDGWPVETISTKLTAVLHNVDDSYIRRICSKKGWTDPRFRNGEGGTNPATDGSDSLNSLMDNDPFYALKLPYVQAFQVIKDGAEKCLKQLYQQHDIEYTESGKPVKKPLEWQKLYESPDEMLEYYTALGNMVNNITATSAKYVDGRQAMLPMMLFPVLAKTAIITIKHFSSKFFSKVRSDIPDITTKKCTQFLSSDDVKSDLLSSTSDEAWKWNCLDIKCPECKKRTLDGKPIVSYLQVRINPTGTWNLVCNNWKVHSKDGKSEAIFDHELLTHRINILTMDRGRAATRYCVERGLEPPESLSKPDVL